MLFIFFSFCSLIVWASCGCTSDCSIQVSLELQLVRNGDPVKISLDSDIRLIDTVTMVEYQLPVHQQESTIFLFFEPGRSYHLNIPGENSLLLTSRRVIEDTDGCCDRITARDIVIGDQMLCSDQCQGTITLELK